MNSRRRILAVVLTLISLPPLVALVEAVAFHVRNRNNGSIVSSNEKREYLLYVPQSYDPARPTPLVITLHGGALWPAVQKDISQWNRLADSHGFIVVYPAGLRLHDTGPRGWRVTSPGPGLAKDVRFISDLIDHLGKSYNVDPTRIYANGLSIGGGMTFALSCTLPDRIAAAGFVAAARFLPWSWCTDPRPVPMISFHGTGEEIVPYEGGTSWVANGSFPNVSEWTARWARRNRCKSDAVESTVAADVTRRSYPDCADDADVVLFTVHGGGHTWPGSEPMADWFLGPTSQSIDATDQMWAFFQEHRLPRSRR